MSDIIKRVQELTGNKQMPPINLNVPIKSDDILLIDFNNPQASPFSSLSLDEQEMIFSILQAADEDEDGKVDEEKLTYLASLYDDGDDGKYLTQEDINIFINEVNNATIVDNYLNQKNTDITMAYLGKPIEECTDDEYYYCYTLYTIENELMASEMAFNDQVASDGWLSDGFDWVKEKTGWFGGLDKKEVQAAIDKQKEIIGELKEVLKSGGDFEAEYERLTGVTFDKETIGYYVEEKTILEMCAIGTTKAAYFTQSLEDKYAHEILQEYVQYYGNEKLALEKFEEDLNYAARYILTPGCSYNITDDYQLQVVYSDHVVDIGSIKNEPVWLPAFDNFNTEDFTNYKQKQFIESFEKSTGIKYSELVENYNYDAKSAFGEANALYNLVNEYIASQESFIDMIGAGVQFVGMAMIAIGGVALIIPGGRLFGAAAFKAGQTIAVAGAFVDDGLETFDTMTNNQGFDKDAKHYLDIGKEVFTDAALIASGYAIGSYAGGVADDLIQAGKNTAYAKLVDIGLDSTLSMATDLMLTGEVDFSSEGFSQVFGLLTGLTISRANNVKVKPNNSPDVSFQGDIMRYNNSGKLMEFNATTSKTTQVDNYVIQGLDQTCASASLINAIVNKPELYNDLSRQIFLSEDGTYIVQLGAEILTYHSASDLPETTAKIVYSAWVEKYGSESDGDFVTRIFSTLFDGHECRKIVLKPTSDNLAELNFYHNGQHTVLTANKNGHSYTFDGIGENGTMLLRDPQIPEHQLEIKPENFNEWQIVGGSYTKMFLLDGSFENKVGASFLKGESKFYDHLKKEVPEEEYSLFLKCYDFHDIKEDVLNEFFRYYVTQPSSFKEFCIQQYCYKEVEGNKEVDLVSFMEKADKKGEEFILQAITAIKPQRQVVTTTYPIRKCATGENFNDMKHHVEEPGLKYDKDKNIYSINGGHLINRYGAPNGNGVYKITLNGQNFELVPTKNPNEYKVYHLDASGKQYRGLKSLATQDEIDFILSKIKPDYTGDDFRPNNAGIFKYNQRYWKIIDNVTFYPISKDEATKLGGGKIPTIP